MKLKTKRKALIIHKLYLSERDRIDLLDLVKKSGGTVCTPHLSQARTNMIEVLEIRPESRGMGKDLPEMSSSLSYPRSQASYDMPKARV